MATAAAKRKPKTKKQTQKHQPKVFTYEWKGLNRDGARTSGELRGSSILKFAVY